MAPSTLSASAGSRFGYRSHSMDRRSAGGASGNWPRIAWLPMTTSSRSPAIFPAARIRCSSSERFIYPPPLPLCKHARERGGLPQARGGFAGVGHECGDLRPWAPQDLPPLLERAGRARAVAGPPRREVAPCEVEQRGVGRDFPGDQAMHREAARLDEEVLEPAGGQGGGSHGPPSRGRAQSRRELAGAIALHALGCAEGAPGGRAPGAAAGRGDHVIIVTRYGNTRKRPRYRVPDRASQVRRGLLQDVLPHLGPSGG